MAGVRGSSAQAPVSGAALAWHISRAHRLETVMHGSFAGVQTSQLAGFVLCSPPGANMPFHLAQVPRGMPGDPGGRPRTPRLSRMSRKFAWSQACLGLASYEWMSLVQYSARVEAKEAVWADCAKVAKGPQARGGQTTPTSTFKP